MACDPMLHQTFQYPQHPSHVLSSAVYPNFGNLLFDDVSMAHSGARADLEVTTDRHQGAKRSAVDDLDGEQRLAKRLDLMHLGKNYFKAVYYIHPTNLSLQKAMIASYAFP